jgi:hypothetical protein
MRLENSVDLFGSSPGHSTHGDFTCDVCKTKYNEGNDATENYDDDSIPYTEFAGLMVCGDCFEAIECEVLARMDDIIAWYKRAVNKRAKAYTKKAAELEDLKIE